MSASSPLSEVDGRAQLVVDLTRLAVQAPDVPTAVSPVLNSLVTHTAAVGSAYFQAEAAVFTARAAAGDMPTGPMMDQLLTHGFPERAPLFAALAGRSHPVFFDDTRSAPAAAGFADLGVESLAAAPVCDQKGDLVGAFLMHTFVKHKWTRAEADLFGMVAGTLASLTARLVAEEQIIKTRDTAIRALGLALEYRDDDTKGHTDRVSQLTLEIAKALGFKDDETLDALRLGAYLHDTGKIGIPDAILFKPAKLDKAEWDVMRTHAAVGHSFARRLEFIPHMALELILHHHEHWDGGGYPEGLKDYEIPLAARIFTVVDVYDALISARPYKNAWSHAEALAEIIEQRGKQFDPEVVDAFLQLDFSQF